MNLEEFKQIELGIFDEITNFKCEKLAELKNLENEYILQNAKYKVGDKFNHPVVGELEISRIVPSFVRKGYQICYEFTNMMILGESELDKSERIEMTVQERLDKIFYEDISLENNLPVVIKGYIDEITEYYEGR